MIKASIWDVRKYIANQRKLIEKIIKIKKDILLLKNNIDWHLKIMKVKKQWNKTTVKIK